MPAQTIDMSACPCCYYPSGSVESGSGPGSESGSGGVIQCIGCTTPDPEEWVLTGVNFGAGFPCTLPPDPTCANLFVSPMTLARTGPCTWEYDPDTAGTCVPQTDKVTLLISWNSITDQTVVRLQAFDYEWEDVFEGKINCGTELVLPKTVDGGTACVLQFGSGANATLNPA